MIKPISKRRKAYCAVMKTITYIAVGIVCALVIGIVGYVLVKGLPNVTLSLIHI